MKLYYSPGACSLAPHIVALEAGLELQIEKVDLRSHKTESGADFFALNPKGYVPALILDDGELLTEGVAVAQYIADRKPEAGLAPPEGSLARYRLQEMFTYLNSELHKNYSPLFNRATPPELRAEKVAALQKRYALIESQLQGHSYLFVVTSWAPKVNVDLSAFPDLAAFQARVAARPAVQAAMRAEGLLK